jgi:hypothetical protein
MSKGKGKIKELLKEWKIDDIVIKTDKEMMSACKSIARSMLFTVHKNEDNGNDELSKGEDCIFCLAEADTNAILHFASQCTFSIPRTEDKKTIVFKDLVNNLDLRAFCFEKDDTLIEKLKTIENPDEIIGAVVRYINNDVVVSPIYMDIYPTIESRMKEMKGTMFPEVKTLSDEELEFVINDISEIVGIQIYDKLNGMFVFTTERKNELIKKEVSKIHKNILLKTFAEDNSKKGRNAAM